MTDLYLYAAKLDALDVFVISLATAGIISLLGILWAWVEVVVGMYKRNHILAIEAEALRRENLRAERFNRAQLDRRD